TRRMRPGFPQEPPLPGVVFLYRRDASAGTWALADSLRGSDDTFEDDFGLALAVTPLPGGHPGDALALVGAPRHSHGESTSNEGAAYAFRRDGATGLWAFEAEIVHPEPDPVFQPETFGQAVALLPLPGGAPGEALALVGAGIVGGLSPSRGGAYVFRRAPGGTWAQEARLLGAPRIGEGFGHSAALAPGGLPNPDGTPGNPLAVRALVGALPFGIEEHPGAAYLFERDPASGAWAPRATFATGATGFASDWFGAAVALVGPWAFVGAYKADRPDGAEQAGAVFAYGPQAVANEPEAPGVPFALSVSPNPSSGTASIALTLSRAGAVRVGVYDALGREVAVLLSGTRAAGRHAIPFDASALPLGVYFVRAETEGSRRETAGHVVTRPLTVVR
ncbi:MAG TPA: T9SS type A sorting domain-containing protein, partial [Rubricoccaceae bacterium]|nr:T9SS type A sorting domain-containing protein [Rubricoccaceae bacterium]